MATGQPNIPPLPELLQDRRVQIGGAVGVVLLIVFFILIFTFSGGSSENYGTPKVLLKSINQVRAIDISAFLKESSIKSEIIQGEVGGVDLLVGEKQYDDAVLKLAGNQIVKQDDFKLFDKTDWASSDEERRVKYIRAVSGEVSRVISRMNGVESATVHMNIPPRQMFKSARSMASASVSLKMKPGRSLNPNQVDSIISIVRGYYAEIAPSHVSITDEDRVYSQISDGPEAGMNHAKAQMNNERITIESRVQGYLDSLLGNGQASVAVSMDFSNSRIVRNNTRFLPGAVGRHRYSSQSHGGNNSSKPAKSNAKKHIYRCSPYDNACQKEYVRQNVSIDAYPSYEQVMIEEPAHNIRQIKVSAVISHECANGVDLAQLKRGIAAAADPGITDEDVEILIRQPEPKGSMENQESQHKKDSMLSKIDWLKAILWGGLALIGIILLAVLISVIRNQNNQTKSSSSSDSEKETQPEAQTPDLTAPPDSNPTLSPFLQNQLQVNEQDTDPGEHTPPNLSREAELKEDEIEEIAPVQIEPDSNNLDIDFNEGSETATPESQNQPQTKQDDDSDNDKPNIIINDD